MTYEPKGEESAPQTIVTDTSVSRVKSYTFPRIRDPRGDLSFGEFGRDFPFEPKRYFLVFEVPDLETRGEHAHRVCEQFLICASGSVSIVVDDGHNRDEVELNAPNRGIYIPPRIWSVQHKYSTTAVLLVFASHYYDADDYVRDYDQFLAECRAPQ